jgi:hypothetical protein
LNFKAYHWQPPESLQHNDSLYEKLTLQHAVAESSAKISSHGAKTLSLLALQLAVDQSGINLTVPVVLQPPKPGELQQIS